MFSVRGGILLAVADPTARIPPQCKREFRRGTHGRGRSPGRGRLQVETIWFELLDAGVAMPMAMGATSETITSKPLSTTSTPSVKPTVERDGRLRDARGPG